MKENLFEIGNSERNRILNLHKSATERQYLSEDITTTQTTTPPTTIKTSAPKITPVAINKLIVDGNNALQLFKDGKAITLYVYVKPEMKNNQPVPGSYKIEISNSREIKGLVYKFSYNCSNPTKVFPDGSLSKVPTTFEGMNLTARYKNKEYKENVGSLLSQLKSSSLKWDLSNFPNLPQCN